jgi:hypothetical protein
MFFSSLWLVDELLPAFIRPKFHAASAKRNVGTEPTPPERLDSGSKLAREQSKAAVTSIDRVIAARFDTPESSSSNPHPKNAMFPLGTMNDQPNFDLDDILNQSDEDLLAQ